MTDKPRPIVRTARKIAKDFDLPKVAIVWTTDDGHFGVVSYGRTKQDCKEAAEFTDRVCADISIGALHL